MSGTLEIEKIPFDCFPVTFSGILHKTRSHTNKKGNVRSTVSEINETTDKLSIESNIDFGSLTSFSQLNSKLKRSSTWLTIYHLKMVDWVVDKMVQNFIGLPSILVNSLRWARNSNTFMDTYIPPVSYNKYHLKPC
jgi:hypothetical protein